jgi:hypothetical protein
MRDVAMDLIEIAKVATPYVAGGLGGAALTPVVTWHRSRIQPIGYRITHSNMLTDGAMQAGFPVTLVLEEDGKQYKYSRLTLTEIALTNSGNRDFEEFRLGVTIKSTETAVQFVSTTPGRYHDAAEISVPTPKRPGRTADIVLKPFNRGISTPFIFGSRAKQPSRLQTSS